MDITHDGTYVTSHDEPSEDTTISFDAYEDSAPTHRCVACGEETDDDEPDNEAECDEQGNSDECGNCDGDGTVEGDCDNGCDSGTTECDGDDCTDGKRADGSDCESCEGTGKIDCPTCEGSGTGEEECGDCAGNGELYTHDWQPIPCGWLNSAKIYFEPTRDKVTVTISVGDPRGAFAMEVEKHPDGYLILRVPYAGESMPHMPLTEINGGGAYRIGHDPADTSK